MTANQRIIEALGFYADPNSYFGAPAPIYADNGKRARAALTRTGEDDWWNDDGLSQSEVNILKARLGNKVWDGLIRDDKVSTGAWWPYPGTEGNIVREILRLYPSRSAFSAEA